MTRLRPFVVLQVKRTACNWGHAFQHRPNSLIKAEFLHWNLSVYPLIWMKMLQLLSIWSSSSIWWLFLPPYPANERHPHSKQQKAVRAPAHTCTAAGPPKEEEDEGNSKAAAAPEPFVCRDADTISRLLLSSPFGPIVALVQICSGLLGPHPREFLLSLQTHQQILAFFFLRLNKTRSF